MMPALSDNASVLSFFQAPGTYIWQKPNFSNLMVQWGVDISQARAKPGDTMMLIRWSGTIKCDGDPTSIISEERTIEVSPILGPSVEFILGAESFGLGDTPGLINPEGRLSTVRELLRFSVVNVVNVIN